ncbi:MAG: exopolysaccharide biosynthesis protein [Alphaproteobacteria bacterium]|nr:exopolysaccharide biosynthesis protein [Alphaproteobacteria bacterium]MBU1517054.1 exopolysaccharide biosynthesis protein [Alphaproteobacteria bacterium]MBU2093673.1 exopolysaccharide biosynthesis protein [Alphaproteobacteria bacterium]MBU2154005.1 exopolysaccharide biosynthesis protein [Alphaproteobacteria bacterium]MBU2308727.1 exopolysaccharide biosynthesis protein [Alphaproteobacteria bacterium]
MSETVETADPPANELPLSAVLLDIAEHGEPRISIQELMEKFGGRAIGALLFIFGLACALPLPPGATTIFGMPLLLLAPQLVIGSRVPWLPERVKARTLSTADLKKGLPKVIPTLQKVEAISKPRLVFLFGPVGERLLGLVCTALAIVLILPIPGGNMLPAIAVSALSFALIQRDGIIALVGYAVAITSASVLVLAAHIIVRMFLQVVAVVSPA